MTAQQKYWEVRLIAKIAAVAVTHIKSDSAERAKQEVIDILQRPEAVSDVYGYYSWTLVGEPVFEVGEPTDATNSPTGIEAQIWDALGGDSRDWTEDEKVYIQSHPALAQEVLELHQASNTSSWTAANIKFAKRIYGFVQSWKDEESE